MAIANRGREPAERRSADLGLRRSFAADLRAAAGRLCDDLVDRTPGADEREVVRRLLPGFEAQLGVRAGRLVVLDRAAAATASAPVELRTGVHDGFVPIVHDGAGPILFEREAEIDEAAIAHCFPDSRAGRPRRWRSSM